MIAVEKHIWWGYLDDDLRDLMRQSALLIQEVSDWKTEFHDYSFIVFPAAKAYEGFLKNLFLDMGFITKEDFDGKRFRIGKALNPTLYTQVMKKHTRYKELRVKMSVYDKMIVYCGGNDLADALWKTWREARNLLFHWFPNEKKAIDYEEAKDKVSLIMNSMTLAFKECKIKRA